MVKTSDTRIGLSLVAVPGQDLFQGGQFHVIAVFDEPFQIERLPIGGGKLFVLAAGLRDFFASLDAFDFYILRHCLIRIE